MLYLTCTTITSVDLAHYGVSRAKDWVSVDRGTIYVVDFTTGYYIQPFYSVCAVVFKRLDFHGSWKN